MLLIFIKWLIVWWKNVYKNIWIFQRIENNTFLYLACILHYFIAALACFLKSYFFNKQYTEWLPCQFQTMLIQNDMFVLARSWQMVWSSSVFITLIQMVYRIDITRLSPLTSLNRAALAHLFSTIFLWRWSIEKLNYKFTYSKEHSKLPVAHMIENVQLIN